MLKVAQTYRLVSHFMTLHYSSFFLKGLDQFIHSQPHCQDPFRVEQSTRVLVAGSPLTAFYLMKTWRVNQQQEDMAYHHQ